MKEAARKRSAWWRRSLESGILLLTCLALVAMTKVRGVQWVVTPMTLSLAGCLLYRWLKPYLFPGVEVVLIVFYFVVIKSLHASLGSGPMRGSGFIQELAIVGDAGPRHVRRIVRHGGDRQKEQGEGELPGASDGHHGEPPGSDDHAPSRASESRGRDRRAPRPRRTPTS